MSKQITNIECPNCLGEEITYNGIIDKYEKCDCETFKRINRCIDYEILEEMDIFILDDYQEEEDE